MVYPQGKFYTSRTCAIIRMLMRANLSMSSWQQKGSVPPALQNCVFTHTAQGVALVMKRALYEINVSEPRWADLLAHERPLRLALNVGEIAGVCSRDQIEEMLAPKFEAAGFAKR